MQKLIGNMTAEEFTSLVGVLIGSAIAIMVFWSIACAFLHSIIDSWAFRKGVLYYQSLRYLNKGFKKLKSASTQFELDLVDTELRSTIYLLRYQRVIPKFMFERLLEKQEKIYQFVYSEFIPF